MDRLETANHVDSTSLRHMGDAARAAFEASDCLPSRNLVRLLAVYASARSALDK